MNDELLSAYLDGELDAEKRQLVELYLAQNVGAALRLENLKHADDLMRDALPRVAAPADDPIARMIMTGERPRPRLRLLQQRPDWRALGSMAAACVLGVLIGGVGFSSHTPAAVMDAHMRVGAALAAVLDSTPSGETAPVMGGEAQMALSLQTADGRFCRQFRLTSGASASDAVACRDDGRWQLVVQALAPSADGAYRTAAESEGSAIDAAVDAMGSTVVLDDAEEREVIAAHWRSR